MVVIAFLMAGCAGYPKVINIEKRDMIDIMMLGRVSLEISKSPGSEKITPEVIKRVESLLKEKLAEKKISIDAGSLVVIKIIFEKYEDGNVAGRGISGIILGVNIGKPAKIAGQVRVSNNGREITKADIEVESSKSGLNFSYGYGGAEMLESAFVEEAIKLLF